MKMTREDLQEFRNLLDMTGDDLDEEVVKHDVQETFSECFGVEVSDHIWLDDRPHAQVRAATLCFHQ